MFYNIDGITEEQYQFLDKLLEQALADAADRRQLKKAKMIEDLMDAISEE